MKLKSTFFLASLLVAAWAAPSFAETIKCDGLKGTAKADCMKAKADAKAAKHKGKQKGK